MFASVGRRLAILNAVMVIAIIATVGLGTALVLRVELNREESRSLQRRAETAALAWSNEITHLAPIVSAGATPRSDGAKSSNSAASADDGSAGNNDQDGDGQSALEGGDVVLYGINLDGDIVINDRNFIFSELPDMQGIVSALAGKTTEQHVKVNGESVRLTSVPIVNADGAIVGVVQAARDQDHYQKQLSIALFASLGGIVLGLLLAPIAGLFLARRAMRPIDAAFTAQRAFIADASHELRTPLAVLRANAELIQRMPEVSSAEFQTETGLLIAEIDEMTRLVNDLLFLAQADDQAPALLRHEPVDLSAVIEAETAAHRNRAALAGLQLDLEGDRRIALVTGDPERLRQVVRILLDNAVAYTPSGGSIAVRLSPHGHEWLIEVSDTGIGIPHEEQERVFDRFYRADRARGHQNGGAGLGLAIARTIVDVHHGSIALNSGPGKGTRVSIRLPARSEPIHGAKA